MEMWVKLDSILPPDVTTTDYFEDFFAGYGQPGYLGEFFELYSEYEHPHGNALAWSQWFDQLAGPQLRHEEPSTPIAGGITSQLPLAAPATLASCCSSMVSR
jgi:hypothetical protein